MDAEKIKEVKSDLIKYLKKIYGYFDIDDRAKVMTETDQLLHELEKTKQEIKNAENYFNSVTDPGLIDHASYLLKANERKYRYLLNQARQSRMKVKELFRN